MSSGHDNDNSANLGSVLWRIYVRYTILEGGGYDIGVQFYSYIECLWSPASCPCLATRIISLSQNPLYMSSCQGRQNSFSGQYYFLREVCYSADVSPTSNLFTITADESQVLHSVQSIKYHIRLTAPNRLALTANDTGDYFQQQRCKKCETHFKINGYKVLRRHLSDVRTILRNHVIICMAMAPSFVVWKP
jgi:hypothetical protein